MRLLVACFLLAACGADEVLTATDARVDGAGGDAGADPDPDGGPDGGGDPLTDVTALDPTFGTGGSVTMLEGAAMAVVTDPADGAIVCGQFPTGSGRLLRLDRHGALDNNFGGGLVLLPRGCSDLARLTDGRLAVLSSDAVRLFGPDGAAVREVPPPPLPAPFFNEYLMRVTALADGGFAVLLSGDQMAGFPPVRTMFILVARYDAAGDLVPSFGTGGVATIVERIPTGMYQAGLVTRTAPAARLVPFFLVSAWSVDGVSGARDPDDQVDVVTTFGTWGSPIGAIAADRTLIAGYDDTPDRLTLTAIGRDPVARTLAFCHPHFAAHPVAVEVDHHQRPVIASRYGGDFDELVVSRLLPDLTGFDPAWGCERRAVLPTMCPGPTCSAGDPEARKLFATDLAITSDDGVLVVGGRWPPNHVRRAWFVARFAP